MPDQYLDFSKLEHWLRLNSGNSLATLAAKIADAIPQSIHRGNRDLPSAKHVLKRLKEWQKEGFPLVEARYQDALLFATDKASAPWFSQSKPTAISTPAMTSSPPDTASGSKPVSTEMADDVVDYDKVLPKKYPPNDLHKKDLLSARNLFLTGLCMRRTGVSSEHDFEDQVGFRKLVRRIVLEENGVVKLIMLHPRAEACRFGWMQDYWTNQGEPEMTLARYCDEVKKALDRFYNIQAGVRQELGDKQSDKCDFLVYPIDYMLTFGLDIIDRPSGAIAYVRYYPLASQLIGEDAPILRLEQAHHPECIPASSNCTMT